MRLLLVEPAFPIPTKSKNHSAFLPIGLLKLASYYRSNGNSVRLVRGNQRVRFNPDKIFITSLFTYWSGYVRNCVQYYKKLYPDSKITVGGIYASLMPEHCKEFTGCDSVFQGIHEEAENCDPAYDLVDVDYQIIHSSRGCFRKCPFCGTWKIEPKVYFKESIKDEIRSNKLVFYDNNFLCNPHAKDILKEISESKHEGKVIACESQCGFDGRLLTPELVTLLRKARFQNIRIAWDWNFDQHEDIKKQVDMLVKAGYPSKDIYLFMLYNWDIPFEEMERKRRECWKWKVQIADCRYRPLNQTFDNYNPRKEQTNEDYFIHSDWTDEQVKLFRRNVRRQNICIRLNLPFYSSSLERKSHVKELLPDVWFPTS